MEDLIVQIPKSWLNKIGNSRDLIESMINLYYKKFPNEAKNFESGMEQFEGLSSRDRAIRMMGVIPDFVYHGVRLVDPDFWKNPKNHDLFFEVYKKARAKNTESMIWQT